jgi:hypothetical protein
MKIRPAKKISANAMPTSYLFEIINIFIFDDTSKQINAYFLSKRASDCRIPVQAGLRRSRRH